MAASNSSAEQLITENIDVWTSAIKKRGSQGRGSSKKIELYGIKKLRELILELAVRGLLVPQDPSDEPASVLLEKIAAEKEQLLKDGKIKKQKPIVENVKDKSLSLPLGWISTLFGNIALIERGGSPRPIKSFLTESPDGLNWIKIGDTEQGGKYITSTNERIIKEGLHKTRMVYPGDFLLTNSMSFGRPYISKITGCIHDGWLRISPPPSIDKDYLYILLSSPFIIKAFKKSAAGAVVLNLNADKVREVEVLIPPEAEQPRIVAKVDELMALCDQLEQQTESSLTAHQTLVETLLNTLLNADQNSFDQAWERIAQHFDVLFTTGPCGEWSIDQLKQTILQLAVMGKLVPQDPNDEPASVLLEKIAAEKEQLIKDKVIKKQKPLPPISEDEKPFELPKGWEYAQFADLALSYKVGLDRGKSQQGVDKEFQYFKMNNILNEGGFQLRDITKVDATTDEINEYKLCNGDFLFNTRNSKDLVGKTCVFFSNVDDPVLYNNNILRAKFSSSNLSRIIDIWMRSSSGSTILELIKSGTTNVWAIYQGKLEKVLCIIPPEAEQPRIIAKVDELMTLCDELKVRLQESQTTQLHLSDAMAEKALNS